MYGMIDFELSENAEYESFLWNEQQSFELDNTSKQTPNPLMFNWLSPDYPGASAILNSEEDEDDKKRYLIYANKTKDSISEKGISEVEKKTPFIVQTVLQNVNPRGKKPLKTDSKVHKIHDKNDIDNIISVVQVHYINFIVELLNYILNFYKINGIFSKIAYIIKKKVNNKNFQALKQKKLYEILLMDISPKFTKSEKDHNKVLYEKIKDIPTFREILNQNYLSFFRNVYYKSERKLNLNVDGKEIIINLTAPRLAMYKDKLAGFEDKYYKEIYEKYVKDKYFEN